MRKVVPLMTLMVLLSVVWSAQGFAQACPSRDEMKKSACSSIPMEAQTKVECEKGAERELNTSTPQTYDRSQEQQATNYVNQLLDKQSCNQIRMQPRAPNSTLREAVELFKTAEMDNGSFHAQYGGECAAQKELCDCATKNQEPKVDCAKKFVPKSLFTEADRSYTNVVELNKTLTQITSQKDPNAKKSDLGKDAMQGLNAAMPGLMMAAQLMARQQQQDDAYPQQYDTMTAQTIDACAPGADGSSVCAVMPQTAGSAVNDSWNKGSSAYSMGDNKGGGSFNPTDMGSVGGLGGDIAPASTGGGAMAGAGIPNGGGGGIPGGGSAGAALGAAPAATGGGGPTGRADIMRGESGGGGYTQQNAALSTAAGNGGGFSGYGKANTMERLNLAEFLPGGRKDPVKRGLAGAGNATYVQIQSKEVNIWNRISERMKSRCSQGLLKDCIH